MPWYVPAILVPAFVLSAWFGIKAFNELNKGTDPFNVLVLGTWARDDNFTPRGRRFRMWSLAVLGFGILLVVWVYVLASAG